MYDAPSGDSSLMFNPAALKEALQHQIHAAPFERILQPIELHIPLAEVQDWLEHLRWLRRYDWGEFTNTQMLVPTGVIEALKNRVKSGRLDKWSRSVAVLTMLMITSSTGYAWSEEITTQYLRRADQNYVEAMVALLEALYQERAQRAPAGPLGFFWLAQGAVLLPSVVAQSKGPVATYFQWLQHWSGGRSRPSQEVKEADRVLAFLLARIADRKSDVQFRQQRRLLSKRERLRLFFGENKNRWTLGAVLRLLILLVSLMALPLGGYLWWKARAVNDEAIQLDNSRAASIAADRKAFAQQIASKPGKP